MFGNLFKSPKTIELSNQTWLLDTFAWALENFEPQIFIKETSLVLPTNEFYPGTVNSIHGMAENVFERTLAYAGMQNWPIKLVSPANYQSNGASPKQLPAIIFESSIRGKQSRLLSEHSHSEKISVSYNPNQVNQPQDLVASFAQAFSMILIVQSGKLPPGGINFINQAVEVVSCFLGFGVMLSNTAYQFKGGCGSCFNPYANRNVALSEPDTLFCLALFTVIKKIEVKQITKQLKAHLRSDFKKNVSALKKQIDDGKHPYLLPLINH